MFLRARDLDLGDFGDVREGMTDHLKSQEGYAPNQHSLEAGLKKKIRCQWSQYMETYGYQQRPARRTSPVRGQDYRFSDLGLPRVILPRR